MKSPQERIAQAQAKLWRRFPALRPPSPAPIPEPGRLAIGRDQAGLPVMLGRNLLSAHVDVAGAIGSGKSTFLRHLAIQQMDSDRRLCRALIQIDPHSNHRDSLHRTTLRHIVKTELYKRKPVFVVDPNSAWCSGIMLLDSSLAPSVVADQMIECFERIRDDDNLDKTPTLRRAMHGNLAALTELRLSLAEADVLIDPHNGELREWALTQITDRYAHKALRRLQELAGDPRRHSELEIETIGVINRLAPVLASPPMRAIIGMPTIDMRAVLDEGAVVLVGAAGGDAASELAGDLLGKLAVRAVVCAAKRRRGDSLALLIADEIPRYATRDFERALAELRKFRVGVVAAHQTYAMLGKPDDPVREAIEKIPGTKITFRLNSMEEAATLAPELLRLNLEKPIEALTKPVVIGYRRTWLGNRSLGINAGFNAGVNDGVSRGTNQSTTTTRGHSTGQSLGEQHTATHSRSHTRSESETDEESWNESETEGENWSTTHTNSQNFSGSDTESGVRTTSSGRSGSSGSTASSDRGTGEAFSYDGNNSRRMQPDNTTISSNIGSGSSRSREEGWSDGESTTVGTGHTTQWGHSSSASETGGGNYSRIQGRGWGHSRTTGEAETTGTSDAYGTSRTTTRGQNSSTGATVGTNTAVTGGMSAGFSLGGSATVGKAEALEPILKNMPGGVHSLENVQHMAGEMLCTLPTGVAVVRTIKDGKLEGAIVRVPERAGPPISDDQYAADLQVVMEHGGGVPMRDAIRQVEARERNLLAIAQPAKLKPKEPNEASSASPGSRSKTGEPEEPTTFRVRRPGGQKGTGRRRSQDKP
jgi:hypothetical protein